MDLDLHLHSTASDGRLPPRAVVARAVEARLDVIALTDHDTVAGVAEARDAAAGHPLHVIPALEVSSTWDETEIHILGYFVDPLHEALRGHGQEASRRRRHRLEEMVRRLADQGVVVSFDSVLRIAGDEVASLGRPHLARALHEAGYVEDPVEAFDHFIGNEHPAYIPTRLMAPDAAIQMIHQAGGLAVWAHPPTHLQDSLLPRLVEMGMDGLEAYRPYHSPEKTRRLEGLARKFDLVLSGGSDWHGPDDGDLGTFRVHAREVSAFLERGGM
jgi:3',5'-nucleoside bisphosphate phosphatase